ncbi:MAG: SUMF1/EgtB/PvdO family nonheme iron enzyme [Marinilabiliaceae bacterium]|jgi:formylglycine-generating enzyme required for sulfatase activity|nr:SUMF1/EgtB/PvdO family nonheme iron enzyme [Marinilabiliaceae bacterium]
MVNFTLLKRVYLAIIMLSLLASCRNNAPIISHNYESDTVSVKHGEVIDLDLRFIDDKNELDSANVSFRTKEVFAGKDTSFLFKLNTSQLPAGNYPLDIYASDQKDNSVRLNMLIKVEPVKPLIGEVAFSDVRATQLKLKMKLLSSGGIPLTEKGLVYSEKEDVSIDDAKIIIKNDGANIDQVLDGLPRNTKLFVRAYAQNNVGVSYSEPTEIKTLSGIPVVATAGISDIHSREVNASGRVLTDGGADLTAYGICFSTSSEPGMKDNVRRSRSGWRFNLGLDELTPFTRYYYRAFASNRFATVYGETMEFETTGPPTVKTGVHGRIMINSVEFSIDVTDNGGHEVSDAGIVYSMLKEPTIDSNVFSMGKGRGKISGLVKNLDPGTKYHMRAYAVNSEGVSYGEEIELFTKLGIPSVEIQGVEDIDFSSAKILASITDDGGLDVLERGIVWDTVSRPNKDHNFAEVPGSAGPFFFTIPGLESGIRYYARAYALNERGIVYSESVDFVPYINTPMAEINGGTFNMGSEDGDKSEQPVHQVSLSPYSIGKYEVSNLEYANFLNSMLDRISMEGDGDVVNIDGIPVYHLRVYGEDYDKTGFKVHIAYDGEKFFVNNECTSFPAILVTWEGARMFCEWAGGRLPTEAEWEFAAKGAKNSSNAFAGSNRLERVGWFYRNCKDAACPLTDDTRGLNRSGGKSPNSIGLYDMSGNAAEWCLDYYSNDYYKNGDAENPMGPEKGLFRVIRGGSWADKESDCTVYRRVKSFDSNHGYDNIGFRLVRPGSINKD